MVVVPQYPFAPGEPQLTESTRKQPEDAKLSLRPSALRWDLGLGFGFWDLIERWHEDGKASPSRHSRTPLPTHDRSCRSSPLKRARAAPSIRSKNTRSPFAST